jgi:predicted amidohydrolase YtcJ
LQLGIAGRTGSLSPGKDADLVVLGADLFRIPPHRIAATPVVLTMRSGRITHEAW